MKKAWRLLPDPQGFFHGLGPVRATEGLSYSCDTLLHDEIKCSMCPKVWTIYGVQVQQQQCSLLKMLLQHRRHLLQDSVALLRSHRHIPDT